MPTCPCKILGLFCPSAPRSPVRSPLCSLSPKFPGTRPWPCSFSVPGVISEDHRGPAPIAMPQGCGGRCAMMGLQWARGPCWGQEQGWVAFAAVSRDAVRLLKALATDLTGEAQGGHCLCVLSPVPIQGGLLTTGEPADFAPEPGMVEGGKELWSAAQVSCQPLPPTASHTHCRGFSPVWMRRWMTRLLLVRKDLAQNSQM